MELSEGNSSSFKNLSLEEDTHAVTKNFTRHHMNPSYLNWEESVDLKVSLEKLREKATSCADEWKDVNAKFDDRRSFPTFLWLLQDSGLDWHSESKENANQLNSWGSLQAAASFDVVHLRQDLASNAAWITANKYYRKSLSLMKLLERIRLDSSNEFSRHQAELLGSFLDQLIMIQQEQRVVAYGFSEHLEQLRKCDAASLLALSSNAVLDDGDMDKCPFNLLKHPMDKFMWQQKHLFDSLHIISRESTWLLRKLESSHSSNHSLVEECHKILEKIESFISKFKNSKELLDQYLVDECSLFNEEKMMLQNKVTLDDFGNCITDLKEQGVGRESVTEMLLKCFGDVVHKGKITMDEYCFRAEQKNPSKDIYSAIQDAYADQKILSKDICYLIRDAYAEAAEETLELINEAVEKLNSVRCSTLTEDGSSLENIMFWVVLFETSLVNLRFDHICKKHAETVKLGVKLLDSVRNRKFYQVYLDQLHASIETLLAFGESILVEFVGVHRTVAEITYMLGDAFTTGGAGMDNEGIDIDLDFPWDKHRVPDEVEIDPNDPDIRSFDVHPDFYGPDSDDEFI